MGKPPPSSTAFLVGLIFWLVARSAKEDPATRLRRTLFSFTADLFADALFFFFLCSAIRGTHIFIIAHERFSLKGGLDSEFRSGGPCFRIFSMPIPRDWMILP